MEMTETWLLPSGSLQRTGGRGPLWQNTRNAILGGENAKSQPESEQLERLKPEKM